MLAGLVVNKNHILDAMMAITIFSRRGTHRSREGTWDPFFQSHCPPRCTWVGGGFICVLSGWFCYWLIFLLQNAKCTNVPANSFKGGEFFLRYFFLCNWIETKPEERRVLKIKMAEKAQHRQAKLFKYTNMNTLTQSHKYITNVLTQWRRRWHSRRQRRGAKVSKSSEEEIETTKLSASPCQPAQHCRCQDKHDDHVLYKIGAYG